MAPLRARYRGFEITGPPPPCAGPLHIGQMLAILEGFDIAGSGFGSADSVHLLAEVLKIAFADRAAGTGDPDFVDVPVDGCCRPTRPRSGARRSKWHRAQDWRAGAAPGAPRRRKRQHHPRDGGGR